MFVSALFGDRLSDLPGPANDVLVACDFPKSTGAAGVKAIGTDADFCPQTKFATVVKSRTGIDHDG